MTLDLPEDLLREAKVLAIMEGKTFKVKMAELLTFGLELLEANEAVKPVRRASSKSRKP